MIAARTQATVCPSRRARYDAGELQLAAQREWLETHAHRWEGVVCRGRLGSSRDPVTAHWPEPLANPSVIAVGAQHFDPSLNGTLESVRFALERLPQAVLQG